MVWGAPPKPRPISREVRIRYCVRELESGVSCQHHLIVHRGEGPCTGMNPYGGRCECSGFQAPEEA